MNCEILLIDDGSTDTSGRICDTYKDRYPDIVKVFHKLMRGCWQLGVLDLKGYLGIML